MMGSGRSFRYFSPQNTWYIIAFESFSVINWINEVKVLHTGDDTMLDTKFR